jgi:hypothetical protein
VSGATSTPQTITFPTEGQFVWYGTIANVVSAAGAILFGSDQFTFDQMPQGPMLLIREGQNGKTFARHARVAGGPQEGFAPVANICGTGQRPFLLPFPVFFNPSDFIEAQLFNGFSVTVGLQLTLIGWKLTQ